MRLGTSWTFAVVLAAGLAQGACGGGSADTPPPSGSGASSGSGGGGAADAGSDGPAEGGGAGGAGGDGGPGGTSGTGGGGFGGFGGSAAADGGVDAGDAGTGPLCPPDEDGDDIPDDVEGKATGVDTDSDGTPDWQDSDSDDDGIPDAVERGDARYEGCNLVPDADFDGTPNTRDTESDGNGIDDADEAYPDGSPFDPATPISDVDGDGTPDLYDADDDDDTFDDTVELVAGAPVDTDTDGAWDHQDIDSDGDGIGDEYETFADADGDGTPNLRDLDSDKDGVPDSCEAGFLADATRPPSNSDGDNKYDAYDVDADNDGLKDGLEDKNFDCLVNVGETDRTKYDTDADGANDLIEVTLGSDPSNKFETPQSLGKYYFVMPYQEPAQPVSQDIVLRTNFTRADIAFVVDTTGSMGPAIDNIKTNLSGIVTAVAEDAPEARFGVLGTEDYPVSPYGATGALGNEPVYLPGPTAYLSSQTADTLAALTTIVPLDGADDVEAQIPAMWKALTNGTLTWPAGGQQNPFSPTSGYGALGFRDDALPILVLVTGAIFHNGRYVANSTGIHDPYSFNGPNPTDPPDIDDLLTVMKDKGAKFLGVALDGGGGQRTDDNSVYGDMATIAEATGSIVLPGEAFPYVNQGGTSVPETQCRTEIAGGARNPDTVYKVLGQPDVPACRLIFSSYSTGAAAGNTVKDGLRALLRGIKLQIRVLATPIQVPPLVCNSAVIDTVADFIEDDPATVSVKEGIQVNHTPVGIVDPSDPNSSRYCEVIDVNKLRDTYCGARGLIGGDPACGDSLNETVTDIPAGILVCFKLTPRRNKVCPQLADVQVARAVLEIKAKTDQDSIELAVGKPRDVFFVIPPIFQ